jgi:hypothetical protein
MGLKRLVSGGTTRALAEGTVPHDVTPPVADQIATAVTHLAMHLRGRLHDASVSVESGGVVIRGLTKSYYVKQLAQHAVMEHVSLPIAANEIVVRA